MEYGSYTVMGQFLSYQDCSRFEFFKYGYGRAVRYGRIYLTSAKTQTQNNILFVMILQKKMFFTMSNFNNTQQTKSA